MKKKNNSGIKTYTRHLHQARTMVAYVQNNLSRTQQNRRCRKKLLTFSNLYTSLSGRRHSFPEQTHGISRHRITHTNTNNAQIMALAHVIFLFSSFKWKEHKWNFGVGTFLKILNVVHASKRFFAHSHKDQTYYTDYNLALASIAFNPILTFEVPCHSSRIV